MEAERKCFFDREELIGEVLQHLQKANAVDVITFSGSGEPTLNKDLGWMLRELKRKTETPLAVITNGSLLLREDVRGDLLAADLVLPSLDAVGEETFRKINRPHPSISVDDVVKGLRTFRSAFKGKIWLRCHVRKRHESMRLKSLKRSDQFSTALPLTRYNSIPSHAPPPMRGQGRWKRQNSPGSARYWGRVVKLSLDSTRGRRLWGSMTGSRECWKS